MTGVLVALGLLSSIASRGIAPRSAHLRAAPLCAFGGAKRRSQVVAVLSDGERLEQQRLVLEQLARERDEIGAQIEMAEIRERSKLRRGIAVIAAVVLVALGIIVECPPGILQFLLNAVLDGAAFAMFAPVMLALFILRVARDFQDRLDEDVKAYRDSLEEDVKAYRDRLDEDVKAYRDSLEEDVKAFRDRLDEDTKAFQDRR